MNVRGVADVDRDRHRRLRDGQRQPLRFPEHRPVALDGRVLPRQVARQLDEQERKLGPQASRQLRISAGNRVSCSFGLPTLPSP
jgi:hypothetical protein